MDDLIRLLGRNAREENTAESWADYAIHLERLLNFGTTTEKTFEEELNHTGDLIHNLIVGWAQKYPIPGLKNFYGRILNVKNYGSGLTINALIIIGDEPSYNSFGFEYEFSDISEMFFHLILDNLLPRAVHANKYLENQGWNVSEWNYDTYNIHQWLVDSKHWSAWRIHMIVYPEDEDE